MLYDGAVVFEGGGMRGSYTCGVIDAFLDNDIEFKTCYGVSSGSCHATSYLSKQRGRALRVVTDYLDDDRFFSLKSRFKTGNMFGVEMMYDTIPRYLDPYDYETYNKYQGTFYSVAFNCVTGKPDYLKVKVMEKEWMKVCASSSLPIIAADPIELEEGRYFDGGIGDSIPVRKSIEDGNKKTVLVLTQAKGYVKKKDKSVPLLKMRYHKYPLLAQRVADRHIRYNETLKFIDEQEALGNIFVIRPQKPVNVGRLETDKAKLDVVYEEGLEEATALIPKLIEYLER